MSTDSTNMSNIKNMNITHLVLSGGGMRGVIFVGALRYLYLNNMHNNIKHIAGCSIGSLIGLMFALKLTIYEMEEVLYGCMKDNDLCFLSIKKYIRLITEFGLFDTQVMIKHLKIIILIGAMAQMSLVIYRRLLHLRNYLKVLE
jgi:predicted acylesterase/phospholipase RssA